MNVLFLPLTKSMFKCKFKACFLILLTGYKKEQSHEKEETR